MKFTIEVVKIDAANRLVTKVFDENGNPIGDRPDSEVKQDRLAYEGKYFLTFLIQCDGKQTAIDSPLIDDSNPLENTQQAYKVGMRMAIEAVTREFPM